MKEWWEALTYEGRKNCNCLKDYPDEILVTEWDDLELFIKNSIVIRCSDKKGGQNEYQK